MDALLAVSPIDGRYIQTTTSLSKYFSEYALIQYRLCLEYEYLLELGKILSSSINQNTIEKMRLNRKFENSIRELSLADTKKVKDIEKVTKHDVKAVEYYLKQLLVTHGYEDVKEWVHFGLTSQDINMTVLALQLYDYTGDLKGMLEYSLIKSIKNMAVELKSLPMLARTHGQPASPTTMGKELAVFVYRLESKLVKLDGFVFRGKMGGAVGNLNAHYVAFPDINWELVFDDFVENKLRKNNKGRIKRSKLTTQIESYDYVAEYCHLLQEINVILLDFVRDMWTYISMNYFSQQTSQLEVGSSTMPHKVNPIDFENAEGNLGVANALLGHFADKLPVSRLQRDLSDSTVVRNFGVALGHQMIAFKAIERGLSKLKINEPVVKADLEDRWELLAEPIQTVLRREGYLEPYELLKELILTSERSKRLTKEDLHKFIDELEIQPKVKDELKALTPLNYVGIASLLVFEHIQSKF